MRTSRHLQLYSILFLFLSTFTSAWPWPKWLPELDALVVRQNNNNNNNNNNSNSASATPTASGSKPSSTGSNSGSASVSPTQTNKNSGSGSAQSSTNSGSAQTTDGGGNSDNGNSTTSVAHSTSYDARLPAGGVSMITPAVALGEQYFKIGDFVTFGWNYTSLEATPTAINVMATCTANSQIYTITMNQTVANNTGAVTWDTGAYQATALSDPLLTETYTLVIFDAESSISATAQAGYLAVYDQYTFGMYTPQPYTPLGDFQCATCSGALSDMERRALGMVVGVSVITVLSFTWFVGGTGIIW